MYFLPFLRKFPTCDSPKTLKTEGKDSSFPRRLVSRVWSEPLLLLLFSLHLIQHVDVGTVRGGTWQSKVSSAPAFWPEDQRKSPRTQKVPRRYVSCSFVSDSLWPHGLLCPWNSPSKNIGVGCHFLLQEIFLTQELNLGLLHCKQFLYWLSHQGSPHLF